MIVEFIDTVADAIREQLIENRFIQLMSIYRSKKSKGELYKHAICKAQIIVGVVTYISVHRQMILYDILYSEREYAVLRKWDLCVL